MQFDWDTFTYDEEWLRQAAQIEEEVDCDICAGYDDLQAIMRTIPKPVFSQRGFYDNQTTNLPCHPPGFSNHLD